MKNILTIILILVAFSAKAQLPTYVPTADLVTYYGFDLTNTTTDLSGNGNNGLPYGTIVLDKDKCGIDSSSYLFNMGTTGIVRTSVDTTSFHNFAAGLSISFWGYIPELAPIDTITHTVIQYGNFKILMDIRNPWGAIPKNFITYVNGSDSVSKRVSDHVIGTDWFNYTVTVSTDSIRIYLDGYFILAEQTTSIMSSLNTFTDGNLYIGGYLTNTDTSNLYYGNIDNVAIYNRAITATEVNDLYYHCPTLAVNNVVSAKNKIYPSPANNNLTIEGNTGDVYYMADVTGKVVKTLKTGTTDISDIANGMYIVTDRATVNQKIIVAH